MEFPEIKLFHPIERLKKVAGGVGALLITHLLYRGYSEHPKYSRPDAYSPDANLTDWQKQDLEQDVKRQLHED